ncbi:MAG: hypothetical protein AAGN66_16240 [Acidobacteriota bacterium]
MSVTGIASLLALADAMEQGVMARVVDAAADAHEAIGARLPRRSGQAAASFFPSVNTPSTVLPSPPYTPLPRAEVRSILLSQFPKLGDRLLLTSNVLYVPAIESRRPFRQAALDEARAKLEGK